MPSPFVIPGPLAPVEPHTLPSIGNGGKNLSSAEILRKHLNKLFKGKGWDSLIAGLATGLDYNKDILLKALDQLFLSRASAKYLTQRASDVGIDRPSFSLVMDDEIFRKLAIKITASKITYQTIDSVLEAFYGFIDTKANILNSSPSPYSLSGGETLTLTIDHTPTTVVFEANDFKTPGYALAVEVAAVITRYLNKNAHLGVCVAERNVTTGLDYLRIITNTIGLKGSIQVTGGTALATLGFATTLHNLYNNPNAAFSARSETGLDVILPVTSTSIKRDLSNGAYLHGNVPIAITSIVRNALGECEARTVAPHGLTAGEKVFVDEAVCLNPIPAVSTCTSLAPPVSLSGASAIVLANGKILFANENGTTSTYLYDDIAGFTQVKDTAVTHLKGAFYKLNDTKYLLIGGNTDVCEIYHSDSQTWTSVASAPTILSKPLVYGLPNGTLLVCESVGIAAPIDIYIYDPILDSWTNVATSNYNYLGKCVLPLPNNWLLLHGSDVVKYTEIYNPITNKFTKLGQSVNALVEASMCYVPAGSGNGFVYKFGGYNGATATKTVERLDLSTGLWNTMGNPLAYSHQQESTCLMPDNKVLIVSGNGTLFNEVYTPTNNSSVATAPITGVSILDSQLLPVAHWQWMIVGGVNPQLFVEARASVLSAGGFNGFFEITNTTPDRFRYNTPEYKVVSRADGGVATSATPVTSYKGCYLYEPNSGVAITDTNTTLNVAFNGTNILHVASTVNFPDSGYVVFDFGKDSQVGPIHYSLKLSVNELMMDNTFNRNLPIGTTVRLLAQAQPFNPSTSVYATWLTASTAGWLGASSLLDTVAAAGIDINKIVKYPGDRGLGNEGMVNGTKLSDKFVIWGGDKL